MRWLETGAIDGRGVFAAPGNPGHRSGRRRACRREYLAAADCGQRRPDGGRSGSAAGGRDRRSVPRARLAHRGPDRGGCATGRQQDFRKELFHAKRNSDCRYVTWRDADRSAHARSSASDFPVVLKADGLAAGRAWSSRTIAAEAEAALDTLDGRLVIEEFLRGRRGQLHRPVRRARRRSRWRRRRITRRSSTAIRARTPAAWAPTATRDSDAKRRPAEVMDRVIYPTVEAMKFTGFLYAGR